MDGDGVEVHFHAKITRSISRHHDRTSLVNEEFILRGTAALRIYIFFDGYSDSTL